MGNCLMLRRRYAMFVTPKHQDWPLVINLVNSIVGVSLLVMPFCFQKCGILLGFGLLTFSTWLTYVSCYLLVKAAVVAKSRSYEHLASHAMGSIGKLAVEISVVGVQLGYAVAIFVAVGDLTSEMLCKAVGLPHSTPVLRALTMTALALGVALPLSLQRDLSNLHHINVASTIFYVAIVAGIVISSFPSLHSRDWVGNLSYWKLEYAFECLPIFALSYACQTQMLVIYESMVDPTLVRMKHVTFTGIGLCLTAYVLVGLFGYVAYWHLDISGNVLLLLPPSSPLTVILKLGFVLSMVFSFPLIVFPCRESLNSLIFYPAPMACGSGRNRSSSNSGGIAAANSGSSAFDDHWSGHSHSHPMTASRLRGFTLFIILFTLVVAIVFPNVEFILALTGATMGSVVCFIMPPLLYLRAAGSVPGQSDSRRAKAVLLCGLLTFCVSTHQTLFNMSSKSSADVDEAQLDMRPQPEAFPRDQSGDAEQHGRVLKDPAELEPPDRARLPSDARRAEAAVAATAGVRSADVNAASGSASYRSATATSVLEAQHNAALLRGFAVYGGRYVDEKDWLEKPAAERAAVKAARQAGGSDRSNRGLIPSAVTLRDKHRPLDESREVADGEAGAAADGSDRLAAPAVERATVQLEHTVAQDPGGLQAAAQPTTGRLHSDVPAVATSLSRLQLKKRSAYPTVAGGEYFLNFTSVT